MAIFPGKPRDSDEAEIARIDAQMARLALALRAAVANPDRHLVLNGRRERASRSPPADSFRFGMSPADPAPTRERVNGRPARPVS